MAIGDELLTGKISDTNSTYVANELFALGLRLDRQTVIADDVEVIQSTIREVSARAKLAICFGGLGPTSDDKTAACVAELLNTKLIEHEASRKRLTEFLQVRNRPLTDQILKQIVYPEGTSPLFNNRGLAVGFSMILGKCIFYFLPGVPDEMKTLFQDYVLQDARKHSLTVERIYSHTWRCLELPESELQRLMDPIEKVLPKNAWLGYRTQYPENHLTLYCKALERPPLLEKWRSSISDILSHFVYAEGNKSIEEGLFDLLKKQNKTLVFVESCTGGIACQRMTRIPGASDFVKGGVVAYTREVKNSLLGLNLGSDEDTVSAGCTKALAVNGKERLGADLAAAITGYLGPTGGTETDPIGTIYIGVMGTRYFEKRIFQPWRDRSQAQWGAASHLLNLLRVALNT